jgi:hypothetical protein
MVQLVMSRPTAPMIRQIGEDKWLYAKHIMVNHPEQQSFEVASLFDERGGKEWQYIVNRENTFLYKVTKHHDIIVSRSSF